MKVFVAKAQDVNLPIERFNYCKANEILYISPIFEQVETPHWMPMTGIASGALTTEIMVKEMAIDDDFMLELIQQGVSKLLNIPINEDNPNIFIKNMFLKIDCVDLLKKIKEHAEYFNHGDVVRFAGTYFETV